MGTAPTHTDAFASIFLGAGRALLSLQDEISTPERAISLLATLGINVPIAPASLTGLRDDLRTIQERVEAVEKYLEGGVSAIEGIAIVLALADACRIVFTRIGALAGTLKADLAQWSELVSSIDFGVVAKNLGNYLLVTQIREQAPALYNSLELLGIVEVRFIEPSGDFVPAHYEYGFRPDRVKMLFTDVPALLSDTYAWGTPEFNPSLILSRLQYLCLSRGALGNVQYISATDQSGEEAEFRVSLFSAVGEQEAIDAGFALTAHAASGNAGFTDLTFGPYLLGTLDGLNFPFDNGLSLQLHGDLSLDGTLGLRLTPPFNLEPFFFESGAKGTDASFGATLTWAPTEESTLKLLHIGDWFTLEAGQISFGFSVATASLVNNQLSLEALVSDANLRLTPAQADGFLGKILPPDGLSVHFDLGFEWSLAKGFRVKGGAGLETTLATNLSLGPVTFNTCKFALRPASDAVETIVATSVSASLGPVRATVDQFGVTIRGTVRDGGNLGPVNLDFGFKPPSGAALTIDAGPVTGGGFLSIDPDAGRYAGVLQLKIFNRISVVAIAIIDTRGVGDSAGWALLVLITAEGFVPIQLGMGFALTGIGGLLALNRTADTNALRAGVKTGALDSFLFPQNATDKAPALINALDGLFPRARERYVIAPMAKIVWGTPALLTIRAALMLEIPSPIRLVIVAKLSAILPDEERALIKIQVAAVGIIDFDAGELSIDASIYDSRVLALTLSGDLALRLKWKDRPSFALAVGGMHPRFPLPAGFPKLQRVSISLATGNNPRLRLEAYFAVTSNSVQFGARAELYVAIGPFSVEGYLGFDALFQFSPFHFDVSIEAGLALRMGGAVLFAIRLAFELSGPKPWYARGEASFTILFFTISFHFEKRWGPADPEPLPAPIEVLPQIVEAFRDLRSWAIELPTERQPVVTASASLPKDVLLAHPSSELAVRQRIAPLERRIDVFGNTSIKGDREFRVTISSAASALVRQSKRLDDDFARAQFFALSDDQKLSTPSFERMTSGFRFGISGASFAEPSGLTLPVDYETRTIDPQTEGAIG